MAWFKKEYHAKIEIKAPIDQVWSILMDLDSYSEWNVFTPKVETDWEIGKPVLLTVAMNEGEKPIQQKEFIRRIGTRQEIVWGMKWSFFLRAERQQKVKSITGTLTEYTTSDTIQGPLCPLVHFLYGMRIQKGFERVCTGLKTYAEHAKAL